MVALNLKKIAHASISTVKKIYNLLFSCILVKNDSLLIMVFQAERNFV